MTRDYDFTIGQNVKRFDDNFQCFIYGEVTDKTRDTVYIKWANKMVPTPHNRWEFEDIKLVLKGK